MNDIFVLIEHRAGEMREVSLQLLNKADQLCNTLSAKLTAVVLGDDTGALVSEIGNKADKIITVTDPGLKDFDADLYKEILSRLIAENKPLLTLIGHTPWGMDLAPVLSVKNGLPLATDGVDILLEDGRPLVIRQIYSGKLFSKVSMKQSDSYLITVRSGACQPAEDGDRAGEVVSVAMYADMPAPRKQFVAFEDTGAGEVDISQAELLVSIGRGVGEEDNVPGIAELAKKLGGSLSCSRPVVDKNWLPKYHQVGTSGKSVKPKVYLSLGISGAFQHIAGITGAGTVIAVNKDPTAPIFQFADYGVVADLFQIVDALKEKTA
jgi:electron transfer flavoprotein alpha subunit